VVIPFESALCYEAPVAALALLAARLAGRERDPATAHSLESSLAAIPGILDQLVPAELEAAEVTAHEFLSSTHMLVVGAGPLSSLAYKIALTVLMENVRILATPCDASEFRHGPAEALERQRPDMLFLLGTDESRAMALRTLAFCRENGARTLVYDAADLPPVHPLLTGLLLNSLTQCFVVHSALQRGILDLDDRVFMGRSVLAEDGARWP
jgi:fructoselysine-6-P-deglycase FrlB-like protein